MSLEVISVGCPPAIALARSDSSLSLNSLPLGPSMPSNSSTVFLPSIIVSGNFFIALDRFHIVLKDRPLL